MLYQPVHGERVRNQMTWAGQVVLRKLEKLAGHRRFMSLGGGFGLEPADDDWDE